MQYSVAIFDLHLGSGGNSALLRPLHVASSGKRYAHPPVLERVGLGEQAQVDRLSYPPMSERLGNAGESEVMAFAVRKDHRRGRRAGQLDRRNRQAEDGAQVQLELVWIL